MVAPSLPLQPRPAHIPQKSLNFFFEPPYRGWMIKQSQIKRTLELPDSIALVRGILALQECLLPNRRVEVQLSGVR